MLEVYRMSRIADYSQKEALCYFFYITLFCRTTSPLMAEGEAEAMAEVVAVGNSSLSTKNLAMSVRHDL